MSPGAKVKAVSKSTGPKCKPQVVPKKAGTGMKKQQLTLAELRDNPLLRRCDASPLPGAVGTLVWAKDYGSIFWPALISESPGPDEEECPEVAGETEQTSTFAFVLFIEPRFRQGLVSWDRIILVDTAAAEEQKTVVMQLNILESNKKLKVSHSFHTSCSLMETFLNVAPTDRVGLIVQKYQDYCRDRKAKYREMVKRVKVKKEENVSQLDSVDIQAKSTASNRKKSPTPTRPRASSKFSLRPKVTAPQPWVYTSKSASTGLPEVSSTSGSGSSNAKGKSKTPDVESLKDRTEKTFGEMEKQMKFESKEFFSCSRCGIEIQDKNEYSLCHDYPFHKSCLVQCETGTEANDLVTETYKCTDCLEKRCFVCKEGDVTNQGLPTKCSKCELHFHRDCLIFNWPQADVLGSEGVITCPLHCCHVCKYEHIHNDRVRSFRVPASKAIRCLLCLATYHKGTCIPAGSGNSIMKNQFLICPRHTAAATESLVPKGRKLGCFICQKKILQKDDIVSCTLCPLIFHSGCVHGEYHLKAGVSLEDYRKNFKCEACHWGKFPLYGEVSWYQQPGSVYWPARILYPKESASRGAVASGEFSVGYCGFPIQFYDHGRRNYMVPLEIGSLDFLKKLNLFSNEKVAIAANHAFHLIKLAEKYRDQCLPPPEPDFKKIEKNLYRISLSSLPMAKTKTKTKNGKRASGKVKSSRDEVTACLCGNAKGSEPVCTYDSGCFNRSTATECDDSNCSGKERCYNRMFSKPPASSSDDLMLEIFVSPCKKGFGLKTNRAIAEGAFVGQYVGEVISKDELAWRRERKSDEEAVYVVELDSSAYIDAEYYGNLTRLMNHSCNPNCRIHKYKTSNGRPVIAIFASRDIEPGEEVTFDYNFSDNSTFFFKCRCKSGNCRGVIGRSRYQDNVENLKPNGRKSNGKQVENDEGWRWEDECATCGAGGELLMCEHPGCSKTHHAVCVGLKATPKGEWICPLHSINGDQEKVQTETHPPRSKKRKLQTTRVQ